MKVTKKFVLPESEMPKQWYNIQADMKNKPMPMLHPATRQPLAASDLEFLFAKELCEQEFSQERWIDIPEDVYNLYKIYRPSPLVRASGTEPLIRIMLEGKDKEGIYAQAIRIARVLERRFDGKLK